MITREYRDADCPRCGGIDTVRQWQWSDSGYTGGGPDSWAAPDGDIDPWGGCHKCGTRQWTREELAALEAAASDWCEPGDGKDD